MYDNYLKAIEKRLQWLRWVKEDRAYGIWSDLNTSRMLPMYEKVLAEGDTFFMNTKFSELTNIARQTIPDDIKWDSSWMQQKSGWLWIAEPFLVPHIIGDDTVNISLDVKISAIGWYTLPPGVVTERGASGKPGRVTTDGAVHFLCFQDYSLFKPGAKGFGPWSYFTLMNGDKLIDRIHSFEGLAKEGPEPGGAYHGTRKDDMMHEIRWIYTAFHLMSQKLATTVERDTDRASKRREQREKDPLDVPEFIKVITLRRMEEARKHAIESGTKEIDWQWQWTVTGHWRNQWYPSESTHKQVWIEAYVKGPEDKPLKPEGTKIYVARR